MNRLLLLFSAIFTSQLIGMHDYSWYIKNGVPGGEWPLVWEESKDNVAIVELLLTQNGSWGLKNRTDSKAFKNLNDFTMADKVTALRQLAKDAPSSTLSILVNRSGGGSTLVQISPLATFKDLIAKIGMAPGDKLFQEDRFDFSGRGLSEFPLDESGWNMLDMQLNTSFSSYETNIVELISPKDTVDTDEMVVEIDALSREIMTIIKKDIELNGLYSAMQWLDFMKSQKQSIDGVMEKRLHPHDPSVYYDPPAY